MSEYRITERTLVGKRIERREVERFATRDAALAAFAERGLSSASDDHGQRVWHSVDKVKP